MATASNEFKLIRRSDGERYNRSAVTLSCRLSPEISAVNMEIRWFKGTDCVCVYKDRHVTEGRGYEGRVSLFTQELERGIVSLQLRDCTRSDEGHYLCQVTDGDRTEEITVEMISPSGSEEEEDSLRNSFAGAAGNWGTMSGSSLGAEMDSFTASVRGTMSGSSLRTRIHEEPHVHQRDRELTEDERVKMDKSALLNELERMNKLLNEKETQLKDRDKELETSKNKLETLGQELQDKTIILEQQKTELAEKNKQLEEKESLLTDRETQLMERDKQLQEKDRLLEEKNIQLENMNILLEKKTKQLQEQTDPESSAHEEMSVVSQDSAAPIKKRKSMEELRPTLSEESP